MDKFYNHQIFETSDGGLVNEHGEVLIRVTGYKGYPGLYKTRGIRRTRLHSNP
jgi:ribosomal protein S12